MHQQNEQKHEMQWAYSKQDTEYADVEGPLKYYSTVEILYPDIHKQSTKAVESVIRSTDEALSEMKKWLRTGVTPDNTRMLDVRTAGWYSDYYHGTSTGPADDELESGATVDYYYWKTPYNSHIGNINLVMMHPRINYKDGTHAPCDRVRRADLRREGVDMRIDGNFALDRLKRQNWEIKASERIEKSKNAIHEEEFYDKYFFDKNKRGDIFKQIGLEKVDSRNDSLPPSRHSSRRTSRGTQPREDHILAPDLSPEKQDQLTHDDQHKDAN